MVRPCVSSALVIGAVLGFALDLTFELTGHPWWFLLMMLICVFLPGPLSFAAAANGTDHILKLRSRLSLSPWLKCAVTLLLVFSNLAVIRMLEISPRAYAFIPLLIPVIATSVLFGFRYGLLAAASCILTADCLFAIRVYDFGILKPEDAAGLAFFTISGAAASWMITEIRRQAS